MLPLDGYVRVSRVGDREGENFISPETQEKAILKWAADNNREVIVRPYELNKSGGTMDRPEFNRIMDRIRNGESGGLLVYKLDRFARSLYGALGALREIDEAKAIFVSVTEPMLDCSTPDRQLSLQMMLAIAEYMRGVLKESWAVSQRSAVERGIHISPTEYLGYSKGEEDGRLYPNAQAHIMVEVFERRGTLREPWPVIAKWLNEVAPKEDRLWTGQAVQRICEKRVYRGEATRYVGQNKDNREPIVNPNAHEALVSEALWLSAQATPLTTARRDGETPLLGGLVRCAGCRYRLTKGNDRGGFIYRHRGKSAIASGVCTCPASIKGEVLDDYVEGLILKALDTPVLTVPDSTEREEAEGRLLEAQSALEEFRQDTATRKKLGGEFGLWLDPLLADVREAEATLERLNRTASADGIDGLASEHYLALPLDDRRKVVAGFIDCVMVRRSSGKGRDAEPIPERVRVLWRGEAPADLPKPRQLNRLVPFDFGEHDAKTRAAVA